MQFKPCAWAISIDVGQPLNMAEYMTDFKTTHFKSVAIPGLEGWKYNNLEGM